MSRALEVLTLVDFVRICVRSVAVDFIVSKHTFIDCTISHLEPPFTVSLRLLEHALIYSSIIVYHPALSLLVAFTEFPFIQ